MNSLNDLLEMTTEMVTNIVKDAWHNGFAEGKKEKESELEPEPKPKPCPFCGKEPRIYGDKPQAYIACVNEKCPVNSETIFFQTREEAIEAWNRRAE